MDCGSAGVYHLIGDVMRSDELASPPGHDAAFLSACASAWPGAPLPVVLAPPPAAPPGKASRYRRQWLPVSSRWRGRLVLRPTVRRRPKNTVAAAALDRQPGPRRCHPGDRAGVCSATPAGPPRAMQPTWPRQAVLRRQFRARDVALPGSAATTPAMPLIVERCSHPALNPAAAATCSVRRWLAGSQTRRRSSLAKLAEGANGANRINRCPADAGTPG